jgi:hypothetical protein
MRVSPWFYASFTMVLWVFIMILLSFAMVLRVFIIACLILSFFICVRVTMVLCGGPPGFYAAVHRSFMQQFTVLVCGGSLVFMQHFTVLVCGGSCFDPVVIDAFYAPLVNYIVFTAAPRVKKIVLWYDASVQPSKVRLEFAASLLQFI